MVINIILCSSIIALFIIFDLLPIFYQKHLKEFWVYTIFISFDYVIHILTLINIKLPSPAVGIKKLILFIFY
jgi:hypothetical protein